MISIQARFACGPSGGRIILEGEWHFPRGSGPFPSVVVCHPHPLYGGNMLNNVVVAICEALSRHSVAAFRFNFRGVGNSGGAFGGGTAEQEDIKASLDFILSTPDIDSRRIGLAGYSFGGGVALPVALEDERVGLLALVSPALADSDWEQLKGCHQAKFIIVGDSDFVIPLERFQQHIKDAADPKQYQVVPGADHSWYGYEEEVAQQVTEFFVAGFSQV